MARNPTWLAVVAAAIRDGAGNLLLQQALPGKSHAGLWEFPGGKVESGENPRLALTREVAEELGLILAPASMIPGGFGDVWDEGAGRTIVLLLYNCPEWSGAPQAREGQAWGWFSPADAARLPMPPIDRALLDGLGR